MQHTIRTPPAKNLSKLRTNSEKHVLSQTVTKSGPKTIRPSKDNTRKSKNSQQEGSAIPVDGTPV